MSKLTVTLTLGLTVILCLSVAQETTTNVTATTSTFTITTNTPNLMHPISLTPTTSTTSTITITPHTPNLTHPVNLTIAYSPTGIDKTITVFFANVEQAKTVTVQDLQPGVTYDFVLTAVGQNDERVSSQFQATTVPLPPIIKSIRAIDTHKVNVTWAPNELSSQDYYEVSYNTSLHTSPKVVCTETTLTSCRFSLFLDHWSGTRFYVLVYAVKGDKRSAPAYASHFTKPNEPESLTSQATNESILLSWRPPSMSIYHNYTITLVNATAATHYFMQHKTYAVSTQFDDLTPGTQYTVTIATVVGPESSDGLTRNVWTLPNVVEHLRATSNQSGTESIVTITWQPPSIGCHDNYNVNITSTNLFVPMVTRGHIVMWPVVPGRPYKVVVYVNCEASRSKGVEIVHIANPLPIHDPELVDLAADSVTIGWLLGTTEYDSIQVTISRSGVEPQSKLAHRVSENPNTIIFDNLLNSTVYNVTFVTLVAGGPSSSIYHWTFSTEPNPVKRLTASVTTYSIYLTWTPPRHQDGFRVSYFDTDTSTSGPDGFYNASITSAKIPSLSPGHRYNVSVSAYIDTATISREKYYSEPTSVVKTTQPSAVQSISLDSGSSGYLNITWEPDPLSIQDYYIISYRTVLKNPTSREITNQTTLTYLVIGSMPGEKYEIKVWCLRDGEMSAEKLFMQIIHPLAPPHVAILRDLSNSSSLVLQWHYKSSYSFVRYWRISYQISYEIITDRLSGTVQKPDRNGLVMFRVNDLTPGAHHKLQVTAFTDNNIQSLVSAYVYGTVEPVCTSVITELAADNQSLILEYSQSTLGQFDQYVIECPIIHFRTTRSLTDDNRTFVLDKLMPGYQYEVLASTVSHNVTSALRSFNFTTYPNHATVTSTSTSRTILLSVHKPLHGWSDSFDIKCVALQDGSPCGEKSIRVYGSSNNFTFDNLRPYQSYHFTVRTRSGAKSVANNLTLDTEQEAPSEVWSLTAQELSPMNVTVSWRTPRSRNGIITGYRVRYTGKYPNRPTHPGDVKTNDLSVVIDGLKAGYNYTFKVSARTIAYGKAKSVDLTMKTYRPHIRKDIDPKAARPSITPDTKPTDKSVTVKLQNVFSEEYGVVIAYTVVVAMDNATVHQLPVVLASWRVAQNDASIKAYQVMDNCTDFFSSSSTCGEKVTDATKEKRSVGVDEIRHFTVGKEECDRGAPGFCNGPLKADTVYYVSLRAFTKGGYEDTPYSLPIRTDVGSEVGGGSSSTMIGTIVGCIFAALALVAVGIFGYCRYLRRVKPCTTVKGMYLSRDRDPAIKLNITRASIRKPRTSHPVKLKTFAEHFHLMSADSDYRFAEEFEDLKEVGRDQVCLAAELPQNRAKNRFTNILPYDHSRIKLLPTDDEEGSDYINANYIPGHNSRREYIVTQGPLPSTRDDFWRMVWEQNCRNIVMLTKCVEKGREKCDMYWPATSEAVFYGDLQVAILNETKYYEWTQTEFKMSVGEQSRKVRHFHYLAWPDFGVPDKPKSLVNFVKMFREKVILDGGPIVAHCSAGVGRSGTFITLDRVSQSIKQGQDSIDIFRIVYEMRKERVWMVQTEQQYICIHQCILSMLNPPSSNESEASTQEAHENVGFEDDEGITIDVN